LLFRSYRIPSHIRKNVRIQTRGLSSLSLNSVPLLLQACLNSVPSVITAHSGKKDYRCTRRFVLVDNILMYVSPGRSQMNYFDHWSVPRLRLKRVHVFLCLSIRLVFHTKLLLVRNANQYSIIVEGVKFRRQK